MVFEYLKSTDSRKAKELDDKTVLTTCIKRGSIFQNVF